MYSVVIHKATRKPLVVASNLCLGAATVEAVNIYKAAQSLSKHGTLASGVSVIVIPSSVVYPELANWGITSHAVYQCGGI